MALLCLVLHKRSSPAFTLIAMLAPHQYTLMQNVINPDQYPLVTFILEMHLLCTNIIV